MPVIPLHLALIAVVGLAPVALFLLVLVFLDSFKLVGISTVLGVVVLGALAAIASYLISAPVMDTLHIGFGQYSRYAAPVVEECLKASAMIYLFMRNRIGFMIDAAILGVAVGAGFSLFENVYYATVFPDANVAVWMVRGLGTAIMHGGVTAIFGVAAQNISERHSTFNPLNYLPGLVAAISIHSIFNQYIGWPLQETAVTIFVLPLILLFVFDKSEHEAHDWLIHDYQSHEHLLADIDSGIFTHSQAGRFISDLAAKFGKEDVEYIFSYLRLHTELVLDAEQLLLARESGKALPSVAADRTRFVELHALERKIGRTAMLTIWPHLKFSRKELWELHQLEKQAARKEPK